MSIKHLVFAILLVVVAERNASAECGDNESTCQNGLCCPSSAPFCCALECCELDERCMPDGTCQDPNEEPPEAELPDCDDGHIIAINACNDGDNACGCTPTCATSADCATGCCSGGFCAMACVCAGQGTVLTTSPTPHACEVAGSSDVEPTGLPPIGGFGGTGCNTSGGGSAGMLLLLALVACTRRRR